jgi:5-methylcytosine-specific restriction endonuclease McrA
MQRQACLRCGAPSSGPHCPRHAAEVRAERKAAGRTGKRGSTRAWRALRQRVLDRDGHRCTEILPSGHRCPNVEDLEVDHLIQKQDGGQDVETNLITRCSDHRKETQS